MSGNIGIGPIFKMKIDQTTEEGRGADLVAFKYQKANYCIVFGTTPAR